MGTSKPFLIGTYSVLFLVAVVMTIMNIATDKGLLTVATGAFAILCVINIILTAIGDRTLEIAKYIFAVEVLAMFTFFLVSGNPEGFSAIWICMLPSLGMIFYNRFKGTLLSAAMLAILIFFLWVPYGQTLTYNYTTTFRMRFPVLFIAFHFLAYFLETLRHNAYVEMKRLQDHYHDLSIRDQLTKMYNRQGMYSELEENSKYSEAHNIGALLFDIDDFKKVNDTYGHNLGDTVLTEFARIIKEEFESSIVCRWGGEEFVVIFTNGAIGEKDIETARKRIASHLFSSEKGEFSVTASIGVCIEENSEIHYIDSIIGKADSALYKAKTTGKNKAVYYENI